MPPPYEATITHPAQWAEPLVALEMTPGRWIARFLGDSLEFSADEVSLDPIEAVRRFIRASPVPVGAIVLTPHGPDQVFVNGRVYYCRVFTAFCGATSTCRGCNGAGRIMLFTSQDDCPDCHGRGRVFDFGAPLPEDAVLL